MRAENLFPKRLALLAIFLLSGILFGLGWVNEKKTDLLKGFHETEVPALQVYSGVLRILREIQITNELQGKTSMILHQSIRSGIIEMDRILKSEGQKLLSRPIVSDYLKLVSEDKIPSSQSLDDLREDLQDFIETYLASNKSLFDSYIELSQMIYISAIILTLLFFCLVFYIYHMYRLNLQSLVELTDSLEKQKLSSMNASKLASLGEMAAGIAHEINNPLAVIVARSDMALYQIAQGDISDQQVTDTFAKILDMSQRITGIVQSMRKISRGGGQFELKCVNAGEVFTDILNLCAQNLRSAEIELDTTKLDPSHRIMADFSRLSQVVINLINNAIDELKKKDGERWIRVASEIKSDRISITVSDNAGIIPLEIRQKIFEPFYTGKDVGKGTGLGLSISKNLMKEMEGELSLDEGEITCFRLMLKKC